MDITKSITVNLLEEDIKEAIAQYVNKYSGNDFTKDNVSISHQEYGDDGACQHSHTEYKATVIETLINLS